MTTTHISPDGLWSWDGTQWVANARPPAPAPKKRSSDRKVTAITVGVVALLFAVAGVGAATGEPNVYEKFQPAWDRLTPVEQDAICTKFETAPNTAKRDVATALGRPGDGDALAGMLLDHVC